MCRASCACRTTGAALPTDPHNQTALTARRDGTVEVLHGVEVADPYRWMEHLGSLLRFHRFTIGWAWTSDYGDPEQADAFHAARAYSPLHNLQEGRAYPPTLLTTADTDDRAVPSHSFKFAAALRHAQGGDAPVLLRVGRSAGHGAGKPTSQVVEERVDVLACHAHHLGLEVEPAGHRGS